MAGRCVHCGLPEAKLFQEIGQDIRLNHCSCGHVVDHYIEFEILLVFIDMQLLRPEVYRHLLFNRYSKDVLRIEAARFLLLCLLLDSYARLQAPLIGGWEVFSTAAETITYFLTVSSVALLTQPEFLSLSAHLSLWEAVSLSSFGKVYGLIASIWTSQSFTGLHMALDLFVALSNALAIQVLLDSPKRPGLRAFLAVALGHAVRFSLAQALK